MISDLWELPSFADSGFPRLLSWARENRVPFGIERSVRLVLMESARNDDTLVPTDTLVPFPGLQLQGEFHRALLSFDRRSGLDDDTVLRVCRLMHCPAEVSESVLRHLPAAGFVHFGYEASGVSHVAKCYLELPAPKTGELTAGRLQFLGFKWRPGDSGSAVVTRYRMAGPLTSEERNRRLLAAGGAILQPAIQSLLTLLNSCGNPHDLLEIQDEGSERVSCDLNLYSAELPLHRLRPALDTPPFTEAQRSSDLDRWMQRCGHLLLGHIATGMDRQRRPFLTIYYGAGGDKESQDS